MTQAHIETATLGGGCFWCLEAVYQRVRGVQHVQSGYAAGHSKNPSYEAVCSETTGHAEVVRLQFDPGVISYRQVLEIFFSIHDPTTLNRQGDDVGVQYRSVIFYGSEEQRRQAEQAVTKANASHEWPDPVVTAVEPAGKFFIAEDYHQEYFANNSSQPYCQFVVGPKVKKFQQKFAARLKT